MDIRYLSSQYDHAGSAFLHILSEVKGGLRQYSTDLRNSLISGDQSKMVASLQQMQKTAESFALAGLARCVSDALDLLGNPDMLLEPSPIVLVIPCLEKSLTVLADFVSVLELEK